MNKKVLSIVKRFQSGGKVSGTTNTPYIPKGKMHRHAHKIDEAKVGTTLTKKGIPVLTKVCDTGTCQIVQLAEIEAAEIIFPKLMVDKIDKFVNRYNENKDENDLVQLGILVKNFLKTTIDATGKYEEIIKNLK